MPTLSITAKLRSTLFPDVILLSNWIMIRCHVIIGKYVGVEYMYVTAKPVIHGRPVSGKANMHFCMHITEEEKNNHNPNLFAFIILGIQCCVHP